MSAEVEFCAEVEPVSKRSGALWRGLGSGMMIGSAIVFGLEWYSLKYKHDMAIGFGSMAVAASLVAVGALSYDNGSRQLKHSQLSDAIPQDVI